MLQRQQLEQPQIQNTEPEDQKTLSQAQDSTNQEEPNNESVMIKGDFRNHVPWQKYRERIELDGVGDIELKEPNPEILSVLVTRLSKERIIQQLFSAEITHREA